MFVFFVSFLFLGIFCLFVSWYGREGVGVTIWLRMLCNLQPGLFLWKSVVNSGYWRENIFDDKFLYAFFPEKLFCGSRREV